MLEELTAFLKGIFAFGCHWWLNTDARWGITHWVIRPRAESNK